ncbi:MAG TPA: efflux RND transporter periplasmic adaptor subunit [Isosphaeraceae bacterium]|nr:efflux RND transporter periplasmic adaptor subunit [Isosphaeraceae bacterium]
MPMTARESPESGLSPGIRERAIGPAPRRFRPRTRAHGFPSLCLGRAFAAVALLLAAAGCRHSDRGETTGSRNSRAPAQIEEGSTAGIRVVHPERRDIRWTVVQPGTIEAFEVTPVYSRIAGYVQRYRYNIGDQVKAGDVLIDMWIPDYVEQHAQKVAMRKRAAVQIQVAESARRAAEAKLETAKARVVSAEAGVKRAQAGYTRWESEAKRLEQLVTQRVLDVQVRDETYRQFEEAAAAREQAYAAVSEANSARDQATADLERARVDVEAARVQLDVAKADENEARVVVEYGQIKAPYAGVITQRNVSPGDYLQPGGGANGRPLFVLEQIDPVRVFVGVPELASFFVHEGDTALIRFQAIPGITREGKVVRSGFALNPTTRTLQTEIDIPNSDGHLHPGWYVTVTIAIHRKQVWALPSNAIDFQGQQNYAVYLQIDGKPVRTAVIIGPSDDTYTEVLRKYVPGAPNNPPLANTNDWPTFDGTEQVLVGNLDVLAESQAATAKGRQP